MYNPCMDYADRSVHVLRAAEKALRGLMAEALKGESYRDLGLMAPVADKLAEIRRDLRPEEALDRPPLEPAAARTRATTVRKERRSAPKPATNAAIARKAVEGPESDVSIYPRFEREGDRLVKVGWSKRDARAYEHKAPKAAVLLFARKVREAVLPGAVFSMEQLLPVADEHGEQQPSYQAYVALAWLRVARVIERRSKDGYTYIAGALELGNLDRLWTALPEKR